MRNTMRPLALTATAALASALLGVQVVLERQQDKGVAASLVGTASNAGAGGGASNEAFAVNGTANGLFPGSRVAITTKLENLTRQSIVIKSLSGSVSSVSDGSCPTSSLIVTPWTGAVTVPGGATIFRSDLLTASMSTQPANACAAATFRLIFSGTATR